MCVCVCVKVQPASKTRVPALPCLSLLFLFLYNHHHHQQKSSLSFSCEHAPLRVCLSSFLSFYFIPLSFKGFKYRFDHFSLFSALTSFFCCFLVSVDSQTPHNTRDERRRMRLLGLKAKLLLVGQRYKEGKKERKNVDLEI